MSREIKFRAWDGKSVRYDVTGFEHGVGNEMAGVFLDGDYFSMVENKPLASHAVVMQYTGLADKDGVDIYEGDILKTPNDDWGVVVSSGHAFEVTVSKNESSLYTKEWMEQCEVIGNIYENPELVGGER